MIIPIISGLRGFTFNDKHNSEFKVVMHSMSIQPPQKKKVKETVPFMNGSYDFSTIGSNGEIVYSEREITIVLGLPSESKEQLQMLYSKILEWIVDAGKHKLVFDVSRDYYYMAEVEESSSFEEIMEFGKLTLKFIAEPFKKSIDYIGANLWDTFNFEEDYLQDSGYDIVNTQNIILYNPGRTVRPIINCSAPMTMTKGSKTYNLVTGDNQLYGFYLTSLANELVITGTGRINFTFRKESL